MRTPFSFVLLSLSFLALVIMAIAGDIPYWAWFIPIGVGIMATLVVFRGSYLPQEAVARGMELIQAQDYNNRLVKVGEPNSDRIVLLFNSLIDKLRAERLQNREHESLLKLLIEASPMGVVMLDFNNKVSMANLSFLKIIGVKDLNVIEGKGIEEIRNDIIPEMLRVPLGKSEIIRKGYYRIYRIYHLNFLQEGFKREFFLLESLTEEIMKAERASYEKVIRTISHEVNNSMGGVKSVLELMAETSDNPDVIPVIQSCENRCERMCEFIREYAEVVKLPSPVLKKFDLGKEITIMEPFLRKMIPETISLSINISENPLEIMADASQIQQVILNILKNAIESIPGKGKIEIKASRKGDGVEMEIINDGAPISSEIEKQLFTPFFTTKPNGKGIGLTFVREVLLRHNTEYTLFTDKEGFTRFLLLFH